MIALTEKEKDTIKECLEATVNGPFFDEWEFQTLFGINRSQVNDVLSKWPKLDLENEDDYYVIRQSLAQLIGYPHRKEKKWSEFISKSPSEVRILFERICAACDKNFKIFSKY